MEPRTHISCAFDDEHSLSAGSGKVGLHSGGDGDGDGNDDNDDTVADFEGYLILVRPSWWDEREMRICI